MLTLENGNIHFALDKCMQCGICLPSCPTNSLSARLLANGLNEIVCNNETCTRCKLCVQVCPVDSAMHTDFQYECYLDSAEPILAWARNEAIRCESSSGGVARTLIVEGLRSGFFDGVYSLVKTAEYPFAEGRILEDAEYNMIPNSVYHPVLAMENLRVERTYRNFLAVGTTCQLASIERLLRGKVENLYRVAIFCKQQKTLDSASSMAVRSGLRKLTIKSFGYSRYRGPGWPGTVHINEATLPWEDAAAVPFGRRLWKVPGCNYCSDPFGAFADLSLMDPWGIEPSETAGKNLVYMATQKGRDLIGAMDQWISTEAVDYRQARESITPSDLEYKRFFRERRKAGCAMGIPERLEQLQAQILQRIVAKFRFPKLGYRFLAHLPDVKQLVLALYRSHQ